MRRAASPTLFTSNSSNVSVSPRGSPPPPPHPHPYPLPLHPPPSSTPSPSPPVHGAGGGSISTTNNGATCSTAAAARATTSTTTSSSSTTLAKKGSVELAAVGGVVDWSFAQNELLQKTGYDIRKEYEIKYVHVHVRTYVQMYILVVPCTVYTYNIHMFYVQCT